MPVLEAMACGAPVLTSNSTALAEVAGDAVVLADLQDPRALGKAMIRALDDESPRAALKVKGFDHAKQLSWEQTGRLRPSRCMGSCAAMTVKRPSLSAQRAESKLAGFCG